MEKHLLLKLQSEVSTISDDSSDGVGSHQWSHPPGNFEQHFMPFSVHVFHGEPDFILQQLPTWPKIPTAGLLAMELLCLVGQ